MCAQRTGANGLPILISGRRESQKRPRAGYAQGLLVCGLNWLLNRVNGVWGDGRGTLGGPTLKLRGDRQKYRERLGYLYF